MHALLPIIIGLRIASLNDSIPQSPHPAGPAKYRRRSRNTVACGSANHIPNSTPSGFSMIVGIPLAWGVWTTLKNAMQIF